MSEFYDEEWRGTVQEMPARSHLAVHETLELHELLAEKANTLIRLKKAVPKIGCPELRQLYMMAIQANETDITQLVGLLSGGAIGQRRKADAKRDE